MARVLSYERAVDAICTTTHTDLTYDGKIQNGVKIKEEIEEDPATLNINTTEHGDINKINLKRKIVETTEELVCDSSSQLKKKRQSSNEISKDENTSCATESKCKSTSYGITINKFSEKRKLQKVAKKKKKKLTPKCNICFRRFGSNFSYGQHKLYYNSAYLKHNSSMKQYKTGDKLHAHVMTSHHKYICKFYLHCNFCDRVFNEKLLLQSHLFHFHNELIYSSKRVKQLNSGSKNHASTSQKGITLKTDAQEKQRLNNPIELEELTQTNTTLINNASNSGNDETLIKTDESKIEESSVHEMLPTKKLRQPTLTEYLELYKKKCDKHSSNKLNIKNESTFTLHHNRQLEESVNPTLTKDIEDKSLAAESSDILKHSILEQMDDVCLVKKPFVKIHADVEMMKAFLDNLSNTAAKENVDIDDTNKSVLFYRELPYSLRSPRIIPFTNIQTNLHSRNKSKNVFKTQLNAGRSTETEQNVIDFDFWKATLIRFKCKDCTIPLIRCDENPKNDQNNDALETNNSLTVQCNSMSFQENNTRNKTVFKELEVSLERLAIFPTVDTKVEAILDGKKLNDSFLCKICNKSFCSKSTKQLHIKMYHIAYMSSICNARYKRKRQLCEHYLQEHLIKLNQCCICNIILPNFIALEQHLNVHCIRYIQRKDDQFPIDKEIRCSRDTKVDKLHHKTSHCSNKLSLSTSISHENHNVVRKDIEEGQNNSLKETSTSIECLDVVLKKHSKNADKISVVCEKTQSTILNPNNSAEKSNKHQISATNENSVVANDLLVKEIETAIANELKNDSQNSRKLLENDNSIINDQGVVKAPSNVESDSKIEICIICGKQFYSHLKLQQHMRIFSQVTDICTICDTGFSSKRFLRTHITAAHVPQFSKSYTFHCMFCNQGFFKKIELRSHVLHLHSKKILNSFMSNFQPNQEEFDKLNATTCNICHLVYETHDRYTEHMMYYSNNHIFTCSLCKQNFRGMYLFHNHYKLTHYSEDLRKSYSYTCEICNEGFKHESHFYSHKMHVHWNEELSTETVKELKRINQFDQTPQIQQQKLDVQKPDFFANLQKHIEQSSDKYTCEICQMKCTNIDHLMIHKAFYSNDGQFQCNSCSRCCNTSSILEQHIKLTHTCRDIYNGYACDICGEVLETAISLKCHEKHFHSNNIDNTDVYKNCGETLSSNIAHKKHQCEFSNISNSVSVGDHYDCLFCDMDFSTASAAKMHIIQVHIDKLLAKHSVSKPSTVSNIQEQSVQKLEEANQVKIVPSELSNQGKSVLLESSNQVKTVSSEPSNLGKPAPFELSNKMKTILCELSNQLKTMLSEPSNQDKTALPDSSNQSKTVLSDSSKQVKTVFSESSKQVKTVLSESSNQGKTVLPESSNQGKTVLPKSSNQGKTVLPKSSNQGKTVLPESSNQGKTVLSESSNQVKMIMIKPSNQEKIAASKSPHLVELIKSSNKNKIIQQRILHHTSPHINGSEVQINTYMPIAPNNVFKTVTPVSGILQLPTRSNNSLSESNISANSGFANVFPINPTSLLNRSGNKSIPLPSSSNGFQVVIMPSNLETNKIIDKNIEAINSYTCPLCLLIYPSLVFFHAHLKYAHSSYICKNPINAQIYLSNPNIPIIKCLLCQGVFTDETKYKIHLQIHRNYMYIPYSKQRKINNESNPKAQTNTIQTDNRKRTTPEVITLDDDDIKNDSDKRTTETDVIPITHSCKEQNNSKIGKLRVKPFAKIIN